MIPRLYAIADASLLSRRQLSVQDFAVELSQAGVQLLQYRDKTGSPQEIISAASAIRLAFSHQPCRLILNDRADLAVLAEAQGVHVGQTDLSPADARRVVGPNRWIGISTHCDEQVVAADASCADYVAIGPVFATGTKLDHEPVIGLEGVRRARQLTTKPLVAIGGITRQNARMVLAAGADSVAVVSGLLPADESIAKVTRDFLDILG